MQIPVFVIYILVVWVLSVFLTIYDKSAAKKRKTRIPEQTLLVLGLVGGAIPMLAVMKLIHHKTKKAKFMVWLPVFSVMHIAFGILCYIL